MFSRCSYLSIFEQTRIVMSLVWSVTTSSNPGECFVSWHCKHRDVSAPLRILLFSDCRRVVCRDHGTFRTARLRALNLAFLSGNLLDIRTRWYDRRRPQYRSSVPFSEVFGRQRRGVSPTIGDILVHVLKFSKRAFCCEVLELRDLLRIKSCRIL